MKSFKSTGLIVVIGLKWAGHLKFQVIPQGKFSAPFCPQEWKRSFVFGHQGVRFACYSCEHTVFRWIVPLCSFEKYHSDYFCYFFVLLMLLRKLSNSDRLVGLQSFTYENEDLICCHHILIIWNQKLIGRIFQVDDLVSGS